LQAVNVPAQPNTLTAANALQAIFLKIFLDIDSSPFLHNSSSNIVHFILLSVNLFLVFSAKFSRNSLATTKKHPLRGTHTRKRGMRNNKKWIARKGNPSFVFVSR
jgi:hypothetical protein